MKARFFTKSIPGALAIAFFLLCGATRLQAQNIGYDYLNQTNISSLFNADGQLFWDGKKANFEAPIGSGKNTMSSAGIWIGGFDRFGALHEAAQTYRESGVDFWPGPLDTINGKIDSATSIQFNKVWKVTKLQIDSFRAGLAMPKAILNWPGNGNTAKGYASKMAPFVDLNGNGIYEPQSGEYPDIQGDVMLWWVYNDAMPIHGKTQSLPMAVEIQVSAYSYNCPNDPILSNTIFTRYKLINRSHNIYLSTHVGLFADLDIGNIFDDYVGCDSATNTFYGYNSTDLDKDTTITSKGSSYAYKGYGTMLPAQSVTFLQGINDNNGREMPMSKFIYYNNTDNDPQGNPAAAPDFYNLLTGHWLDGRPLTHGGSGYGGTASANYAFPGKPGDKDNWNELSGHDKAGDRRGLGVFGPFTFTPGQSKEFTAAFGFHLDPSGKTSQSLQLMRDEVNTLTKTYKMGALSACSGLSTCQSGDSCVWPGDASDDKTCSGDDLFRIGYAFGATGPARALASASWTPQQGKAWGQSFPDGENYKYADCNGDGVIDSLDVIPMFMNYSQSHSKSGGSSQASSSSDPVMRIILDQDTVLGGKILSGKILLGDAQHPVPDVYGISFDLTYDPSVIDPQSNQFDLSSSNMGSLYELLALYKSEASKGTTHISLSRKNQLGKALDTVFIAFKYVVDDDLAGYTPAVMGINSVSVVDSKLKAITVNTIGAQVVLGPIAGIKYINFSNSIGLFPNPAQNTVNVELGKLISGTDIYIYNMQGKLMKTLKTQPGEQQKNIDIADFPSGLYIMDISTPYGEALKKFSKIN